MAFREVMEQPSPADVRARPKAAVLYLLEQHGIEPESLHRELELHQAKSWLYLGDDAAWRVRAEQAIGGRVPRVSIAGLMDEVSWDLRQPYIDWIGELSQVNNSSEWWASGLAEKNPYGKLFVRICLLASAKKLIAGSLDHPTLIVCASKALLEGVVRVAGDAQAPIEVLARTRGPVDFGSIRREARRLLRRPYRRLRRLVERLTGRVAPPPDTDPAYRRDVLARHDIHPEGDFSGDDAILIFTWVDRRNFTANGKYIDPHLGCLPEMLHERGFRLAYVPRVLPTIPFREAVERLARTGECLFFPELFVSLSKMEECRRRADGYQPRIPSDSRVREVMVSGLAQEEVEGDRHWLAETLAYEPLVARLAAAGVRPRQILHTTEGHRWEHVLAYSARQHMPGTKVVGYDPGTYSRMQLSLYHSPGEVGMCPVPDRIVTNGPQPRDTLATDGLPSEIIRAGCAMRFPELSIRTPQMVGCDSLPRGAPTRVLVATSIALGDSVELAAKAIEAFGGDPNVELLIKPHPMVSMRELTRLVGDSAQQDNVSFVNQPIRELLPSVRVLVYTHTTVCFEALWHGVAPVFVRAENALNLDKLEATPEVRWVATTLEELRQAVSDIVGMSGEERRTWRDKAASVLAAAMAPITPECLDSFIA